jgi:NTP pyrophosphatase (non-canonical NTP hydrolase)
LVSVCQDIESIECQIKSGLTLVANFSRFLKNVEKDERFKNLLLLLKENKKYIDILILRIFGLIESHVDVKYANPHDDSIAMYLWALWLNDKTTHSRLLDEAIKRDSLWWSRLTAKQILKESIEMRRENVPDEDTEKSLRIIINKLLEQLEKRGKGTFSSRHEILGMVDEEHDELKDAVRSESIHRVKDELADIAVGCIWGIASIEAGMVDW